MLSRVPLGFTRASAKSWPQLLAPLTHPPSTSLLSKGWTTTAWQFSLTRLGKSRVSLPPVAKLVSRLPSEV